MKTKVRVLYPTGASAVIGECAAGDVFEVDSDEAARLVAIGYVEEAKVERASKAPGEKRNIKEPKED